MTTRTGIIYLLHFDRPYKHARHYLGWTTDLENRLQQHASGHGARLVQVIQDAGITWTLSRTWTGGRNRERQLKQNRGARLCPECGIRPRIARQWRPADLTRIAQRFFKLIDGDWITDQSTLSYARKKLRSRINAATPIAITPGHLLGWTEKRNTMRNITYTVPYVRADGSVWCVEEDAETGTETPCRMVIDLESQLCIWLPDHLVDVTAKKPISRQTSEVWPLFRWATRQDLAPKR
ncbi:hypothetical protein [Kibdelosporangium aridum]|uniref:hypothetical protein n=1 Tax=Kibdelosporangium aridum TaxID=2030 RepID=UPI00163BCA0E|nr:hypothetical protein [Kibdelosporangium aridum]